MTINDLDPNEAEEFKIEAFEMLDESESCLLMLDRGGDFQENYDAIFRVFHSLKGAAGMLEMTDLQAHMHNLETLLTDIKTEEKMTKKQISYFLDGVDIARKLTNGEKLADMSPSLEEPVISSAVLPQAEDKDVESSQPKAFCRGTIAILSKNNDHFAALQSELIEVGFDVHTFSQIADLIDVLKLNPPDVILCDDSTFVMSGGEFLCEVESLQAELPLILLTSTPTKEMALKAMNQGVFSVLKSDTEAHVIVSQLDIAIEKSKTQQLLNRTINLFLFHFSDFDDFLKIQGNKELSDTLHDKLKLILKQRQDLKKR